MVSHKKYRYSRQAAQKPDSTPAAANKRLAATVYQLGSMADNSGVWDVPTAKPLIFG
jgi:hypothetical protein